MARKNKITSLRDFPSVEELLQASDLRSSIELVPRAVAARIVKETVSDLKKSLRESKKEISYKKLCVEIHSRLEVVSNREIKRVINATGIVVHTNLGRAPISEELFEKVKDYVCGYSSVEFDLDTGKRGNRGEACEDYLATLAGSESATIVNNCAAALFVILNTVASRRKVIVSRGELVQIGGGFRIPDILKRSGAKLLEVGTTNITTVADYTIAAEESAAILKVHKSNFSQRGFAEEVLLSDLVRVGKEYSIPVINDLGSGVFVSTKSVLGHSEATVQQSVRAGADLTCFSGDKMLGGVQAGLIVGKAELIREIKRNPIFRALRVDKLVLTVLEHLFRIYLDGRETDDILLWRLLSRPVDETKQLAKSIVNESNRPDGVKVSKTIAFVGGGSLPDSELPSYGILFDSTYNARELISHFRSMEPPIIGRIEDDCFILDCKALTKKEISPVARAISELAG